MLVALTVRRRRPATPPSELFGPTAYDASDKPIRCFRVVASPEFTVEEFCVEASRIHQINYGT